MPLASSVPPHQHWVSASSRQQD
ncbi:hypothetical protein CEXT_208791, partial [Caerostris extrusa]